MKKRISALLLFVVFSTVLLSGCSTMDSITDEVVDQVTNVVQSTDAYVMTIQNTYMNDTTYTYKDVFDNFFAYPTWKHFTSDDGQDVVEFTGDCTYDGQNVKAKIQFLITEQSEDYISWDTTYLSFNNISQPLIVLAALLEKAVEDYGLAMTPSVESTENQFIENVKESLGVPDNANVTYTIGEEMYKEAWDAYYVPVSFYEDGNLVAGANVDPTTGELMSNILTYQN